MGIVLNAFERGDGMKNLCDFLYILVSVQYETFFFCKVRIVNGDNVQSSQEQNKKKECSFDVIHKKRISRQNRKYFSFGCRRIEENCEKAR